MAEYSVHPTDTLTDFTVGLLNFLTVTSHCNIILFEVT